MLRVFLPLMVWLTIAPAAAAEDGAADRLTLRDGKTAVGLVLDARSGTRGGVEMLIRRDWAEANLPDWFKLWDRSAQALIKPAVAQRLGRLKTWRRDRAAHAPNDDPVLSWIDRETARLNDPKTTAETPLMVVRVPRSDVRELIRRPKSSGRLVALGWLCGLTDAETMSVDDLGLAVEGRGFAVEGDDAPSLDRLLPTASEPESRWSARRAATELAVDSDLRFIRYQGLLLPDARTGQPLAMGGLDAAAAFGQIARLLDPNAAEVDPLPAALRKIADRGRAGAAVTRLEIEPDLSNVRVESTLWVLGPRGWFAWGSRTAAVRPEDVKPGAAAEIGADPQITAAFNVVEKLGLGAIPDDLKERSLKIGAAASQALGLARAAFSRELDALALPVLEPAAASEPAARTQTTPVDKPEGSRTNSPARP